MTDWHVLSTEEALRELKSDPQQGLDVATAERRQEEFGFNELKETGGRSV